MIDFGAAAIGALCGELLKLIKSSVSKALKFKKTTQELADTVECLNFHVAEMRRLIGESEGPSEEIDRMIRELEEITNLVSRFSNIRCWQVFCLSCYQDQLHAKDDSLLRSIKIMEVGVKKNLLQVTSVIGRQFSGLCGPPAKPDFIVGFDEPFNKSKINLFKEGSSVHVLTGIGGSGKTTLAKKLCWDEQVRGNHLQRLFVPFCSVYFYFYFYFQLIPKI